jgi:uncharacterized membrane protein YdfJ with MMPL/SSD domain
MLRSAAELAYRRPRRVLAATFALFLVCVAFGAPVAGLLSTGDDFADPGAESELVRERIERATGRSQSPQIVALVRLDEPLPATSSRRQEGLGDRLPLALAILSLTTLVILFVMTRSLLLPVKALAMNVLTISAAFGVLVLVFQDGRLEGLLDYTSQGAIESTQPLVLLAIVFGLSTDYGVFLLARIKEHHDAGASNDEAIALGLERTGRIVTAAALLFMIAIGAFATSSIVFIKQVGLGTAVAVLIDATVVRALLVPSLMKLLGERNWWAPGYPLRV